MRFNRKWVYGAFLAAVLAINLFLTLQSSADTSKLSEGLRQWLLRFGLRSDPHSFRSNAHLAAFFVIGVAMALFGRECGWKWSLIFAIGCGLGLLDEGIKILLPTREFDWVDLLKDWIGEGLGIFAVWIEKEWRSSL